MVSMTNKMMIEQETDRLSSLPDDVLTYILAQLPHKSAVSTSVLSRRYRDLWTQISFTTLVPLNFTQRDLKGLYLSSINLQSIKTLSIGMSSCHRRLVEKVIKDCPVLEELDLFGPKDDASQPLQEMEIHAPSVKRMRLIYSSKVVVFAPKVELFYIYSSFWVEFSFSEPPLMLREAKIVIHDRYETKPFGLLKVVNSLQLHPYMIQRRTDSASRNHNKLPLFQNLVWLTLSLYRLSEWNLLINLLEYCPAMEVLRLNFQWYDIEGYESSWLPQDTAPVCLQNRFKSIEIEIQMRPLTQIMGGLLNLLKYLRSNAIVLEQIVFRVDKFSRYDYHEANQLMESFRTQFNGSWRSSSSCSIKLVSGKSVIYSTLEGEH